MYCLGGIETEKKTPKSINKRMPGKAPQGSWKLFELFQMGTVFATPE
jgi:hypothetical protein